MFELENYEDQKAPGQVIRLVEKTRDPESGKLILVQDGTIPHELIDAGLKGLQYRQKIMPSRELSVAITYLETALLWLEKPVGRLSTFRP